MLIFFGKKLIEERGDNGFLKNLWESVGLKINCNFISQFYKP